MSNGTRAPPGVSWTLRERSPGAARVSLPADGRKGASARAGVLSWTLAPARVPPTPALTALPQASAAVAAGGTGTGRPGDSCPRGDVRNPSGRTRVRLRDADTLARAQRRVALALSGVRDGPSAVASPARTVRTPRVRPGSGAGTSSTLALSRSGAARRRRTGRLGGHRAARARGGGARASAVGRAADRGVPHGGRPAPAGASRGFLSG